MEFAMRDYDSMLRAEIERHKLALEAVLNGALRQDGHLPKGFAASEIGRDCERAQIEMLIDAIETLEGLLPADPSRLAA